MTGFVFVRNIRSTRRSAFLFFFTSTCGYGSSTLLGITDLPASLDCCLVDRCDPNPSWPGRLCLRRVHRTVRHTPYHSSQRSHLCRRLVDPSHSKANGRTEWKANRVPITRTQLSSMEVAIPDMYEQDETPQMSQYSSSGSFIDVEGQLYEKPAGQSRLDENVENGVDSATESSMT
jgi:hypothetical protein